MGEERKTPGLGQRKRKYNVDKLTNKGQIIVSLWCLCRVWNNIYLLCTCHWGTEAGQEEEEDHMHKNLTVNINIYILLIAHNNNKTFPTLC